MSNNQLVKSYPGRKTDFFSLQVEKELPSAPLPWLLPVAMANEDGTVRLLRRQPSIIPL
jgi:hypothetical protein